MIYPGHIISSICAALRFVGSQGPRDVAISDHQANGAYGVHQAKAKIAGDPTVYRIIVAPADAPITINGRPIGEHFAQPIGDA